jgi:hypothetical protein
MRRATVVVALAIAAMSLTPANATILCPADRACVNDGVSATGSNVNLDAVAKGISNKLFVRFNDLASSVHNTSTTLTLVLYEHTDGGGDKLCVAPGQNIPDLSAVSFDNMASSHKFKSAPCNT